MFPAKFLPVILAAVAAGVIPSANAQNETQYGDLALRVVGMLEEEHFLREPFNDKMSQRTLESYLEVLDYSRIYFTKEDVDGFKAKFELFIDDQVRAGGIPAAFEIFSIYEERVRSRVELAKTLAVEGTFTYDSDRTIEISRKDSEWAKAGTDHDQLWRDLIEGDLIREKLIAEAIEKRKIEKAVAMKRAEEAEKAGAMKKAEEAEKAVAMKKAEEPNTTPASSQLRIAASVGSWARGAVNDRKDVATIQQMLRKAAMVSGNPLVDPGPEDGKIARLESSSDTIRAIKQFQRRFFTYPDGLVEVGGRTWRELSYLLEQETAVPSPSLLTPQVRAKSDEAPMAAENEAPMATENEAPKAAENEAPMAAENEAPMAAKNEAPKTAKTVEDEKSIYEKVSDRYDRILKRIKENNTEDVAAIFIKSIAMAYDPHSEYFSQQQYDNFRIGMNKSLTGIGAMLQKDEDQGGATIEGLVVGGPAFKVGKLTVKDRVIGVAQGPNGEFVDVVEMKLSDIVDLIRGEIGSMVRLKLIPVGKTDEIEFVDIVRDKIDLKDSLATADLIITKDPTGKEEKLGWITLPSFYADMDGGQTSTTTDVRNLLTRLSIEGINGLVVDLRDNGGGSLEEAINMTGLFIRKGPVVQSIDWKNNRDQKFSRNGEAVYSGPLIVLINRASASASEIFAAALQDYGRAVIVGDESTFGKGTVQQLRPVLGKKLILPFSGDSSQEGALKLTIQTFYRINGHSTQRHGVVPEVRLPSMLDIAEIGEASLPNALVVDPIEPSKYLPFFETPISFEPLQQASAARIASGTDFEYILKDIAEEKERIEKNTISLNLKERKEETTKAEAEREVRKKDRIAQFTAIRESEKDLFTIYKLTQDNVLDEKLTLRDNLSEEQLSGMARGDDEDSDPDDKLLEYPHKLDPYERETIRILQDLIAIGKTGKPVNISGVTPEVREKTVPIEARSTQPN